MYQYLKNLTKKSPFPRILSVPTSVQIGVHMVDPREPTATSTDPNRWVIILTAIDDSTLRQTERETRNLHGLFGEGHVVFFCLSISWMQRTNHQREQWEQIFEELKRLAEEFGVRVVACFSTQNLRWQYKLQNTVPDLLTLHGTDPEGHRRSRRTFILDGNAVTTLEIQDNPEASAVFLMHNGEIGPCLPCSKTADLQSIREQLEAT